MSPGLTAVVDPSEPPDSFVNAGLCFDCNSWRPNQAEMKVESHLASLRRAMLLRPLNRREMAA